MDLRIIEKIQMVVSILLVGGALVMGSANVVYGMVCGVSISLFNACVMTRTFRHLDDKKKLGHVVFMNIIKLMCILGAIFLVINFTSVNLISFMIGLSTMMISIIGMALFRSHQAEGI